MNFFDSQDRAHNKTRQLVVLFGLAVTAIITAIYLVVAALLSFSQNRTGAGLDLWQPEVLAAVTGAVLVLISLGSLFKTLQLRQGGSAVARMLGGVPIAPNTTQGDERKLLNVVEEMAIAAGTAVPDVYLLPNESAINAFAAGYASGDAAVGVTRGSIEKLTRDELQGVIAHEFSHILNGDMRLNIRLIGILNGILVISMAGYFLIRIVGFGAAGGSRRSSRRGGRGGGGAIVAILGVGLTMMVVGYIGLFFGRLIKAAVSRQREYLADASAVQFTRNPAGISGALKKIGGFPTGSRLSHPRAEVASHMFFGLGGKKRLLFRNLLATHPPLEARIRAIDPAFDGAFAQLAEDFHAPAEGAVGFAGVAPGGQAPVQTTPRQLVDQIGSPTPAHLSYSAQLLDDLPAAVREAAREPFSARAVIYTLLLDPDPAIREAQLTALETDGGENGPRDRWEASRLAPIVAELGPRARLPLVDLALPALRGLSRRQFDAFCQTVQTLVDADQKLSLFEFTLQKVLLRHLRNAFDPRPRVVQYHSIQGLREEARVLLSTLAYAGHTDLSTARAAFGSATAALGRIDPPLEMTARETTSLSAFDQALDRLALTSPPIKQRVLSACAASVAYDGQVTTVEAELLRAVADGLDAPMPPILASVSTVGEPGVE